MKEKRKIKIIYLLVVLVSLVFLTSGCDDIVKKSPTKTSINNNPHFSLESIEKEVEFSFSKEFLLDFKERQEVGKKLQDEPFIGVKINKENIGINIPKKPIYGVSISGRYTLFNKDSFARVILVDSDDVEWLIFGTDFLFLEGSDVLDNVCDETCVFDKPIIIKEIRVEGTDSNLFLNQINYKTSKSSEKANILKERQYDVKLQRLQNEINSKSLSWTAGETSVSKKYYRDLKKLFIGNELANLNGFQYYKGGVFKLEDD
jgi:hypothetical protein